MKLRHYLAIGLLVAIAIVFLFGLYKFSTRAPSEVEILGPSTVQMNELVILAVEGGGDSRAWLTVPWAQQRVMEDGKLLVLVFSSPGEYTVILGTSDGKTVALTKHVITVEGEAPEPGPEPPDPPDPPEPEPEPDPDVDDWIQWTYKTALATVTTLDRAPQATALAGALRSVAAKIAAGAIHTPREARIELRAANNRALGVNAIKWADFSLKFSEHCMALEEAGDLRTLKQYRAIYIGVAKGLDKVAKEKVTYREIFRSQISGCKNCFLN